MKKLIFIFFILLTVNTFAQESSDNQRVLDAWSLYSGTWRMFVVEDDSLQSDSLFFNPGDTLTWSRKFLGWPTSGIHILIGDTATAGSDSINYQADLYQSGFNFDPDTSTAIFVKTLSWKSHTSSTGSTTISAAGYYAANITDTAIFPFRFCWIKWRGITDNSVKTNNNWVKKTVNGYAGR